MLVELKGMTSWKVYVKDEIHDTIEKLNHDEESQVEYVDQIEEEQ
jgi:hypothetical protein